MRFRVLILRISEDDGTTFNVKVIIVRKRFNCPMCILFMVARSHVHSENELQHVFFSAEDA